MVVFGQKRLCSGKAVVFENNWLYSCSVIVFGQSGCIRAKWLHSGKNVVFGQKWLYSGKVVVIGKSGRNLSKLLYSTKVVVFRAKVVVFLQKLFYLGKSR